MLTVSNTSPAPVCVPVVGGKAGVMVCFPTGESIVPLPAEGVPQIGVAEIVPIGGGTYRVIVRLASAWQLCTRENLLRLGISLSVETMQRLIRAGFVCGNQPTPQIFEFDYYSYEAHQRATRDPEFWDRVEPGQTLTNRARNRAMCRISPANKD